MTKIKETIRWDDTAGTMIVQETHDFNPTMELAKSLKSTGQNDFGSDNKLVGIVPAKMFEMWAKKWGVKLTDHKAMQDVVAREMMDPDNAHLRVWDGKF